jgi:glucokinase
MSKTEKFAIGVDLGGTNVKVGIVSQKGKIINKTSLKTEADGGPKKVFSQISNGINELLHKNKLKIKGIGIGLPGVVSIKKGTVENPPNLPGWGKVKLAKLFEKEFKLPVHIENDANAAAIGEMIFGAGKKYSSFIMITLGTGVGGGIIMNNKIFRGENGVAGEVGHTTIDFKGDRCKCGSFGCIETFVGNNYLIRRVYKELQDHKDSLIWKLIDEDFNNLTPKVIHNAAEQNDEYANLVINNMGIQLGSALASVSNLLDISTFIIGGGIAGFGTSLFDATQQSLHERVLKTLKSRIKVIPAKLKNDAGIQGASALVFYKS